METFSLNLFKHTNVSCNWSNADGFSENERVDMLLWLPRKTDSCCENCKEGRHLDIKRISSLLRTLANPCPAMARPPIDVSITGGYLPETSWAIVPSGTSPTSLELPSTRAAPALSRCNGSPQRRCAPRHPGLPERQCCQPQHPLALCIGV